jgi:hypothetical protein
MSEQCRRRSQPNHNPTLTPEEDAVGDPDEQDDDTDDTLPADLWFRASALTTAGARLARHDARCLA